MQKACLLAGKGIPDGDDRFHRTSETSLHTGDGFGVKKDTSRTARYYQDMRWNLRHLEFKLVEEEELGTNTIYRTNGFIAQKPSEKTCSRCEILLNTLAAVGLILSRKKRS